MGETQSRPVDTRTTIVSRSSFYDAYIKSITWNNITRPYLSIFYKPQHQQQQQPLMLSSLLKSMKLNVAQCAEAPATATVPPPPVPPPPPPLPSPTSPSKSTTASSTEQANNSSEGPQNVDSIEAISKSVSAFSNPGTYEQAMSDGKRLVMVDTFDGFRCDINKQVSPFMAAIHSFHLGSSILQDGRKNSYTFISQVADEHGLLMARIDPMKGSLDGRIHKPILGGIAMGKLQLAVTAPDNKDGAAQANDTIMAELDFGGNTWTGNIKYGSMGGGLVYGMNYIQSIHPNVAAGGEGMYIASTSNFISSYGMKFNWKAKSGQNELDEMLIPTSEQQQPPPPPGSPPSDEAGQSMLCVHYNTGQMVASVNYKRCITPNRLLLGAELQFNPMTLDSQVLIGAEYKWQRSKLNLCIDGAGRIQSLLEAKYGISPGSPSLLLSAEMDHYSDIMKFGYGITIES
jgi:mitochondrial import receptor subunit TOM40